MRFVFEPHESRHAQMSRRALWVSAQTFQVPTEYRGVAIEIRGDTMFSDTRWHRHLANTLDLKAPFDFAPFASAHRAGAESIKMNCADNARAAANIVAWRTYLPEVCIAAMVNDGWQWTT